MTASGCQGSGTESPEELPSRNCRLLKLIPEGLGTDPVCGSLDHGKADEAQSLMQRDGHPPRSRRIQRNGELAPADTGTLADLSQETLESLTDEVKSSGSFSSSGGLQPWSSASGSKSESGSQPSRSEWGDNQSELSDFKANVKKLSRKWIHNLKGKETNSEQYRPDTEYQTETTQASLEELNALQSFCTVKANLIHHRANSKGKKSSRHKKLQLGPEAEAPEVDALKCTVPDELLNRIYFKNMRTTPKQVGTAKQHISSRCPDCIRKRAELAQSAFLKQKKTLLESLLLQEKIDEHLYTKDFLTLVREAHQSLPRLSDDPRRIWERLNERKVKLDTLVFERSDIKQKM